MREETFALDWYGKLTMGNLEQVVCLFRQLLDGKRYTFVVVNAQSCRVKTSQQIEHRKSTTGDAFSIWYDKEEPTRFAGFNVCDTYGVWGLSTSEAEQPYIVFEWNKVTINHKNGFGETLIWVIAVEGDR